MPVEVDAGALVEVAIAAWRLESKVDGERAGRYVRGVVDALAGAGVETRQYTGTRYESGLGIRVLAFQPMPGLEREEIIETHRPAVYLRGELIAMSEVTVGTPGIETEEQV